MTASLREAAKNGYQPTKDKNVVSAKGDYDNLVAIFNEAVALVFNLVFNSVFIENLLCASA